MFGLLQQALEERDTLKNLLHDREQEIAVLKAKVIWQGSENEELKRRNEQVSSKMKITTRSQRHSPSLAAM